MKKFLAMIAMVALSSTGVSGQIYSNATDLAIPDTAAAPPVSSSITVAGFAGLVTDLNVCVALNHTFDGDLNFVLEGPGGVQHLSTGNGGSGDNYGNGATGTIFDDAAATAITAGVAPFAGSFRPEITAFAMPAPSPSATAGNLGRYNGASANGTWRLWLDDTFTADSGTLRHWSLSFNGAGSDPACNLAVPPPPATPLGSVSPTSGFLQGSAPHAAGQIQWYSFTTTGTIATPNWLIAETFGSTLTPNSFGPNDTEIALFDSTGTLLVENDDINFGGGVLSSRVSAGGTPPPQVPAGGAAGPASLAAGTYYVAAGSFNSVFANGFSATSTGTTTGTMQVTIRTPEPATLALFAFGALALVRRRR